MTTTPPPPAPLRATVPLPGEALAPVWFLDVDGTIAPLGERLLGLPGTRYLYPRSDPTSWSVPFEPWLLDRIAALHNSGRVQVQWLTTWEPSSTDDWERVGFGPFPHAARPDAGRRRWWKANVVEAWLAQHPDRCAVWTDDDLPARVPFATRRLLTVRPQREVGLTCRDLDRIERWLTTQAELAAC